MPCLPRARTFILMQALPAATGAAPDTGIGLGVCLGRAGEVGISDGGNALAAMENIVGGTPGFAHLRPYAGEILDAYLYD